MRVILLKDTANLGKTGDIKDVSDGYARNFLLPQRIAEIATSETLKKAEAIKEQQIQKEKEGLEKNQETASAIESSEIVIKAKGEKGKLFGSIGEKEIVRELKKHNFEIKESSIILKNPIKKTGESEILIKFNHGIEARLKLIIKEE